MIHLVGFGGDIAFTRTPWMVEHRAAGPEDLRIHVFELGTADFFGGANERLVCHRVDISPALALKPGPAAREWRVHAGAFSFSLPKGMAVLSTPTDGEFELRFLDSVFPAPRIVLLSGPAEPRMALPHGQSAPFALETIHFLAPVACEHPTQVEAFGAALAHDGKRLLGTGAHGAAGWVDLAGQTPKGQPVRERWFLIPIAGTPKTAVPMLLATAPARFDPALPFAEAIADSTRLAA